MNEAIFSAFASMRMTSTDKP